MSWIKVIGYKEATGKLKKLYDRIKGPNDSIDHVLSIHSLRPHTLQGHMMLYKNVLHHPDNSFDKWYLEFLGTYVSRLNSCDYCEKHHSVGLKNNLNDPAKYLELKDAMISEDFSQVLTSKEIAGVHYAVQLTNSHDTIVRNDLETLREMGLNDGEILEINQVVCYFNYVNRMVVGLGVQLEKDNIGLSPQSNDSDDWSHK